MRGIGNIIFGGIFIVGGLSGKLALRGTNSTAALVGVGVVLLIIGVVRVVQSRSSAGQSSQNQGDESPPPGDKP